MAQPLLNRKGGRFELVVSRDRLIWAALWTIIVAILFARPLLAFVHLVETDSDVSYLCVIPLISAYLLFLERRTIFKVMQPAPTLAFMLLFGGGLTAMLTWAWETRIPENLRLSLYVSCVVLFLFAGFAFLFGKTAFKAGYFPLFFLLLMVPIPRSLLDPIIHALQAGSAEITGWLFDLIGVPALREGFVFHLANVNIEVAKECSGIRSSTALLVLALLVVHFCFRSIWSKLVFLAWGLFMMILKNGIRIVTLTLLAIYVDPGFLTGRLHHEGGVVFFLIGLLLLLPVFWALRRTESRFQGHPSAGAGAESATE